LIRAVYLDKAVAVALRPAERTIAVSRFCSLPTPVPRRSLSECGAANFGAYEQLQLM